MFDCFRVWLLKHYIPLSSEFLTMSGGNLTDGFCETRPVLGDLTNRPVKRGFSVILGDNSGDGYCEDVDVKGGDSKFFPKKVCLGVENLVREKCRAKFGVDSNEKGLTLSKDRQACGSSAASGGDDTSEENIESFVSKVPKEIKDKSNLLDGGVHGVKEVGDASRDSLSSGSMPTCSGLWKKDCYSAGENYLDDEERNEPVVTQSNLFNEGLTTTLVCKNGENSLGDGKLAATNYGSIEWSKLPKSQGSKFRELGKCTALNNEVREGIRDLNTGDDVLKACSCSFCVKGSFTPSYVSHFPDCCDCETGVHTVHVL